MLRRNVKLCMKLKYEKRAFQFFFQFKNENEKEIKIEEDGYGFD